MPQLLELDQSGFTRTWEGVIRVPRREPRHRYDDLSFGVIENGKYYEFHSERDAVDEYMRSTATLALYAQFDDDDGERMESRFDGEKVEWTSWERRERK